MQTSRFQLGLIATLAVGLGFSLSSSDAVGYPAGSAVSMGENPIWSTGGRYVTSSPAAVMTAPVGQDLVVTDVVLTFDCTSCDPVVDLKVGGVTVGSYAYRHVEHYGASRSHASTPFPIRHNYTSGIRVPAGESLTIQVSRDSVNYSLSGYYTQP